MIRITGLRSHSREIGFRVGVSPSRRPFRGAGILFSEDSASHGTLPRFTMETVQAEYQGAQCATRIICRHRHRRRRSRGAQTTLRQILEAQISEGNINVHSDYEAG